MKTTFDVLNTIYPVLNVASVTDLINGEVWRRKKPLNRQFQDIVILSLPVSGEYDSDLQEGTFMVNIFCPNTRDGLPDETTLKSITDAVILVLQDFEDTSSTGYFILTINSENLMSDENDEMMSFVNIRVNYTLES